MTNVEDRYLHAAKIQELGPDFADVPTHNLSPTTFARVMAKADELKQAETAELKPELQLPFEQLVGTLRLYFKHAPLSKSLAYLALHWSEIRLPNGAKLTDGIAARQLLELLAEAVK